MKDLDCEFSVPNFHHGPAPDVVDIWRISQRVKDLCLSSFQMCVCVYNVICVVYTPYKYACRIYIYPKYRYTYTNLLKGLRHQTASRACKLLLLAALKLTLLGALSHFHCLIFKLELVQHTGKTESWLQGAEYQAWQDPTQLDSAPPSWHRLPTVHTTERIILPNTVDCKSNHLNYRLCFSSLG